MAHPVSQSMGVTPPPPKNESQKNKELPVNPSYAKQIWTHALY